MAIFEFNDSLLILAGKPVDDKFGPYVSIAAANTAIPQARRYNGLIFGVYTNPSDLPNSDVDYYYYFGDFSDTEYKKLISLSLQQITNIGNTTTSRISHADAINNNESTTLGQVLTLIANATGGVTGDFVPYTGATKNVILGDNSIIADSFRLDLTPTSTQEKGRILWNESQGGPTIGLNNNYVSTINQDGLKFVRNQTGTTIQKGRVVSIIGTSPSSEKLLVGLTIGNGTSQSRFILGIAGENISNNQNGYVVTDGRITNINTTGSLYGETWTNGDYLYVNPNVTGGLTRNKPVGPLLKVPIAVVIKADSSSGILEVKPIITQNVDDLNNSNIITNTLANKDIFIYNNFTRNWENRTLAFLLGGTASQFVKGNGTLDSTTYQTLIIGAATTITDDNLTPNLVVVTDNNGKIATTGITITELLALSGITGNVQEQLDEALQKPVIGDILLKDSFEFVSGKTFTLSEVADEINTIYVNGQYISDEYYSLSGNTVTFNSNIDFDLLPQPDQITIYYIKEIT